MWLALDNIQMDLDLQASFPGGETMVVLSGSFRKTLKLANKICKYLESKEYKQDGAIHNVHKQGAIYKDNDGRKIVVALSWSNEVHVYFL